MKNGFVAKNPPGCETNFIIWSYHITTLSILLVNGCFVYSRRYI